MLQRWRRRSKIFHRGERGYDYGNPSSEEIDLKDLFACYDLHRKYIEGEGNLINHRIGWVLSIHGFLYASYGIVLTNQMNQIWSAKENSGTILSAALKNARCSIFSQSEIYLLGITLIGMAISICGAMGSRMAQVAMMNVARSFRIQNKVRVLNRNKTYSDQQDGIPDLKYTKKPIRYLIKNGIFLPGLTGGGDKWASKLGSGTSIAIPIVLAIGWFISLIVLLKASSSHLRFACDLNVWLMIESYLPDNWWGAPLKGVLLFCEKYL